MTAQQTHEKNLAWIDEQVATLVASIARHKAFIHNDSMSSLKLKPAIDQQIAENELTLASLRANRKVLERHGAEVRYVVSEDGGSFDTEEEALDSFIGAFDSPEEEELARSEAKACLTTFVICSECAGINNSAMEDADEWVYLPEVYFPCNSYTDITEGLGIPQ